MLPFSVLHLCARSRLVIGLDDFLSFSAPSVWNTLPYEARLSNTLSSSNSSHKSHVFKLACYCVFKLMETLVCVMWCVCVCVCCDIFFTGLASEMILLSSLFFVSETMGYFKCLTNLKRTRLVLHACLLPL